MVSRSTLRRVTTLAADAVADALLPQRCIVCDRFGAALHLDYIETLSVAAPPRCGICWVPVRRDARRCARCAEDALAYAHLRTPFRFTAETRRALLEEKFPGVTKLIEPLAGAAARAVPLHWRIDAVVPVPLHRIARTQTRVQPGGDRLTSGCKRPRCAAGPFAAASRARDAVTGRALGRAACDEPTRRIRGGG